MKKMRNILFLSLLVIAGMSVLFTSCEEEDDYNYDNITPELIGGISGPMVATADGISPFEYKVVHRGGSTYDWAVEGHGATVEKDEQYPNIANIIWDQSSVDSEAIITVTETTQGGQTATATDTVTLQKYCPYPMEDYAGNYTGTQIGTHSDPVEMEVGEQANTLRVHGLAHFVSASWGENWTDGDGSCVMEFKCGDVVEVANQWIGDTDYPDTYVIEGSGTVDTDTKTITLTYQVFYGGGSTAAFDPITTVLTPTSKAAKQFIENQVKVKDKE